MAILVRIVFIAFFLTGSHALGLNEDFRSTNIFLSVGESQDISITDGAHIQISKRGIIDAQRFPAKVRIVGLKTGLIVMTLTFGEKSSEDFKYFITVRPKTDDIPKHFEDIKSISEGAGLLFVDKTQEVRGFAHHYLLYYRTKELCEQKKTCSFSSLLSEKARLKLTQFLDGIFGENFEVRVKANGSILVLTPCSDQLTEKEQGKVIGHLIGNELLQKNLLVACKKDLYSGYYTLFSKMIVMESNAAKDIGLQTKFELGSSPSDPALKANLDFGINAAIKNKKAKLIGEPVLWLLNGVEARAQSGSELQVMKEQISKRHERSESTYTWKELGLDLKVKAFPLDSKKVRLQYSFSVSNPSSKDTGQIHRNRLESEVELTLDRSAIVGGIQFKTSGDHTSSVPFLDAIPILGPLLSTTGESKSESSIFLYFYLTRSETVEH